MIDGGYMLQNSLARYQFNGATLTETKFLRKFAPSNSIQLNYLLIRPN